MCPTDILVGNHYFTVGLGHIFWWKVAFVSQHSAKIDKVTMIQTPSHWWWRWCWWKHRHYHAYKRVAGIWCHGVLLEIKMAPTRMMVQFRRRPYINVVYLCEKQVKHKLPELKYIYISQFVVLSFHFASVSALFFI